MLRSLQYFFFFCKSRYLTIGNRNDGRCVPASLCFLTHYFSLSYNTHFSEKTQQACGAINEKVVFHCFLFIQNRKLVSISPVSVVIQFPWIDMKRGKHTGGSVLFFSRTDACGVSLKQQKRTVEIAQLWQHNRGNYTNPTIYQKSK